MHIIIYTKYTSHSIYIIEYDRINHLKSQFHPLGGGGLCGLGARTGKACERRGS